MSYRFQLEKYRGAGSRFTCPNCGKKREFVRYLDAETGNYLSEVVGRCNREVSCGFHYTPKEFFADHPEAKPTKERPLARRSLAQRKQIPTPKFETIPGSVLLDTLSRYERNNFVQFLRARFGLERTLTAIRHYLVGTWKDGRAVFWQLDKRKRIRAGKLMEYDRKTGHRLKHRKPSWVHWELRREARFRNGEHVDKSEEFLLKQCFFGEHLLSSEPGKSVGVVESEKTAIVASLYMPELVWVATGGSGNLDLGRLKEAVSERKTILYPDSAKFASWQVKVDESRSFRFNIQISDLLERRLSEEQKALDFDIADILLNQPS